MSQQARAWVYLAATIVLVGLLIAGIISNEDVQMALGYIGMAVGLGATGLAAANTSIKPPPPPLYDDDHPPES